jgi:site-specific DNA-methyltransferase (adenine-specific)
MPEIPVNVVIQGDCLEILRTLPDASVDSVVTDPPSGIAFMAKEWDDFRRSRNENDAGRDNVFGRVSQHGPEYARSSRHNFISWLTPILQECLRVLKPGGHALVWSIPRTSHWTATAIEDAGFEIRDSILHCFGSGFPKSLNISKALDKAAGAERKVVKAGKGADPDSPFKDQFDSIQPSNVGINTTAFKAKIGEVTEPATEDAKKWDGWGTQLKPAYENWILARKPLAEKNVVSQVLKTGTGAMNIDGCRVEPTGERLGGGGEKRATFEKTEGWQRPWMSDPEHAKKHTEKVTANVEKASTLGRYPANLVLSHSPSCKLVGTQTVEAPTINRFTDGMKPFGEGAGHPYETTGGGTEERAVYECEPGCPVAALDAQSGERQSGGKVVVSRATQEHQGVVFGRESRGEEPHPMYGDEGGASRFFANFEPDVDVPFIYAPKASKSDKNADLDGYEDVNKHPTVKSQQLMIYLVRLVTPKGGIVLDPFAGSGSTLVAAASEGFRFIGIEREEEYHRIAVKRVNAALGRAETEAAQRGAFNAMDELEQE